MKPLSPVARVVLVSLLINFCLSGCDKVRTRNPNFSWSSTGVRQAHGLRATGHYREAGSGATEAVIVWRGQKQRAMDAQIVLLRIDDGKLVNGIAVGGAFLFSEPSFPWRVSRLHPEDFRFDAHDAMHSFYAGSAPTVELTNEADDVEVVRTFQTFLSFDVNLEYDEQVVERVFKRMKQLDVQKFAPPAE